jgi:large subunit ribosomal protein L10
MSKNNLESKKAIVAGIREKLEKAQSVILVDYRGITVEEDTALRAAFRKEEVEYAVLKNTMVELAAKEAGIEGLDDYLKGPTAVAFGYQDPVAPARIAADFMKKSKKAAFKCGVVDKKFLDQQGVTALSELPSKEVLIAKIMGSLNAPITNFVYAIEAIRKQKAGEGEGAEAPAAEE